MAASNSPWPARRSASRLWTSGLVGSIRKAFSYSTMAASVFPALASRLARIVVRVQLRGIEFDRPAKMLLGLGDLAVIDLKRAQIVVRHDIVGFVIEGPLEMPDRLAGVLLMVAGRQVELGLGEVVIKDGIRLCARQRMVPQSQAVSPIRSLHPGDDGQHGEDRRGRGRVDGHPPQAVRSRSPQAIMRYRPICGRYV